MYYVIPNQNILLFIKETEWKIKNRNKNIDTKIKEFFDDFYVKLLNECREFLSG